MANPQAENGHVDIAHEIIEALARYRINGEATQCLWVVFRKTYGWKKKEDEISLSQFAEMTGLKRSNVARALAWLVSKKILCVIKEDTNYANKYRFNKDFETWEPAIKKDTTRKGVIKEDNEVLSKKIRPGVSKKIHTKETSTKETIKRNRGHFIKPTFEEVKAYCEERKNGIDPQYWLDKYDGNGWKVGKAGLPMKDWKAVIRTWEKTKYDGGGNGGEDMRSKTAQEELLIALKNQHNTKLPPLSEPAVTLFYRIGKRWDELQKRVVKGEDIFSQQRIPDFKTVAAGQ